MIFDFKFNISKFSNNYKFKLAKSHSSHVKKLERHFIKLINLM